MKLDYDCVRDILIALENHKTLEYDLTTNPILASDLHNSNEDLSGYEFPELIYCSIKMYEAELVDIVFHNCDGGILDIDFCSITFRGHQYLDNIRTPIVWSEVKSHFATKAISMSFDLILSQAQKIALSFLH